ncbi:1961_t:CDS:2, partial [Acaulospora morrowiae]
MNVLTNDIRSVLSHRISERRDTNASEPPMGNLSGWWVSRTLTRTIC